MVFDAGEGTAQGIGYIFHADPVLPAIDEVDEVHVGERGAGEKTIIEVPRGVVDHDEFEDDRTVAGVLQFCDSIRMFPSIMDLPTVIGFASCARTSSVDSAIASPIMPIRQAPRSNVHSRPHGVVQDATRSLELFKQVNRRRCMKRLEERKA